MNIVSSYLTFPYVASPEARKAVDQKSEVAGFVPARKVNIASVKAAFNRVTAVRLINPVSN